MEIAQSKKLWKLNFQFTQKFRLLNCISTSDLEGIIKQKLLATQTELFETHFLASLILARILVNSFAESKPPRLSRKEPHTFA